MDPRVIDLTEHHGRLVRGQGSHRPLEQRSAEATGARSGRHHEIRHQAAAAARVPLVADATDDRFVLECELHGQRLCGLATQRCLPRRERLVLRRERFPVDSAVERGEPGIVGGELDERQMSSLSRCCGRLPCERSCKTR